jgi:hypothetical protein
MTSPLRFDPKLAAEQNRVGRPISCFRDSQPELESRSRGVSVGTHIDYGKG